jgi:hypothetical protein
MSQEKGSRSDSTKGFWFFFDVEDTKIAAQTTVWSNFRESIYVNDEQVSSQLSLRGHGTHEFNHAGSNYAVSFKVVNVWNGEIICELYRENNLISSKRTALYDNQQHQELIIGVLTAFVISFVFSFLIAYNV